MAQTMAISTIPQTEPIANFKNFLTHNNCLDCCLSKLGVAAFASQFEISYFKILFYFKQVVLFWNMEPEVVQVCINYTFFKKIISFVMPAHLIIVLIISVEGFPRPFSGYWPPHASKHKMRKTFGMSFLFVLSSEFTNPILSRSRSVANFKF